MLGLYGEVEEAYVENGVELVRTWRTEVKGRWGKEGTRHVEALGKVSYFTLSKTQGC